MKATTASIAASAPATAASSVIALQMPGLAQYGTSWPIVGAALLGAVLALPDLPQKTKAGVAAAVMFAFVLGALGGPIVEQYVSDEFGFSHRAITLLIPFCMAYFANDTFRQAIRDIAARLAGKKGGK